MCGERGRRDDGEGGVQVAPARLGIEPGLRTGMAQADQGFGIEWNAQGPGQRFGQFQRLVVATFAQALRVQGYTDQPFGQSRRRTFGQCLDHQAGKQPAGSQIALELETRFEQIEWMRVAKRCPGRGEWRLMPEADAATIGGVFEWQGAACATTPVQRQIRPASGAKIPSFRTFGATEQAAWRQQGGDKRTDTTVNLAPPFQVDSLRQRIQTCRLYRKPGASMSPLRHDWSRAEVRALLDLPFADLLHRAHGVHRAHHDANAVQISTLLSIKTGGCPEDCAYCPQAARYSTGVDAEKLLPLETVIERASQAKAAGATRFCMGAAWRSPKDRDVPKVAAMIRAVHDLGMETCATLGMLSAPQAEALRAAGLDYYNHNLDTAPEFYADVITTREYQDRLDTLGHVRNTGMKTCCGGIVGMGESRDQRAGLLQALATLPEHPQSVPINRLVQVEGTPLAGTALLDPFEFVRTVAVARIIMLKSMVRLSAGRAEMSDEVPATESKPRKKRSKHLSSLVAIQPNGSKPPFWGDMSLLRSAAGRSFPNSLASCARNAAPPRVPTTAPTAPANKPPNIAPACVPRAAPHNAPTTMRVPNCIGTFRLGVLGTLSVINSPSASAVVM